MKPLIFNKSYFTNIVEFEEYKTPSYQDSAFRMVIWNDKDRKNGSTFILTEEQLKELKIFIELI